VKASEESEGRGRTPTKSEWGVWMKSDKALPAQTREDRVRQTQEEQVQAVGSITNAIGGGSNVMGWDGNKGARPVAWEGQMRKAAGARHARLYLTRETAVDVVLGDRLWTHATRRS
jgi:hypothetical protein